ncbi:hypothetical protein CJ030_MR6G006806 [Morella rubra]|uniref:Uncharacterized protein n=1 Tax=Morella rubra TaxID=262757 RepID=A0A6A1VA95_9ROSI|nr:hypothetical protein CJ030_MR6G006806 [Morella rubra]
MISKPTRHRIMEKQMVHRLPINTSKVIPIYKDNTFSAKIIGSKDFPMHSLPNKERNPQRAYRPPHPFSKEKTSYSNEQWTYTSS